MKYLLHFHSSKKQQYSFFANFHINSHSSDGCWKFIFGQSFIGWAAKIHLTWNECFHVLNLLELCNMIALSGTRFEPVPAGRKASNRFSSLAAYAGPIKDPIDSDWSSDCSDSTGHALRRHNNFSFQLFENNAIEVIVHMSLIAANILFSLSIRSFKCTITLYKHFIWIIYLSHILKKNTNFLGES